MYLYACTVSVCMHESLAPSATPDGIFWISSSVSASPLILTPLYLVCVCVCVSPSALCLSCRDATDRILIIVQIWQPYSSLLNADNHLVAIMLQFQPTQNENSCTKILGLSQSSNYIIIKLYGVQFTEFMEKVFS